MSTSEMLSRLSTCTSTPTGMAGPVGEQRQLSKEQSSPPGPETAQHLPCGVRAARGVRQDSEFCEGCFLLPLLMYKVLSVSLRSETGSAARAIPRLKEMLSVSGRRVTSWTAPVSKPHCVCRMDGSNSVASVPEWRSWSLTQDWITFL